MLVVKKESRRRCERFQRGMSGEHGKYTVVHRAKKSLLGCSNYANEVRLT